jgi:hypothetical protein
MGKILAQEVQYNFLLSGSRNKKGRESFASPAQQKSLTMLK